MAELQLRIADAEQVVRVAETRREHAARVLGTLAARHERLDADTAELGTPLSMQIDSVNDQLAQETADLEERGRALAALNEVVQSLQARQRSANDDWQQASRTLAEREARAQALAALQARIDAGPNVATWLASRGLAGAARLWQHIDVEPGWEDALEAVLRERLNAIELSALESALEWTGSDALPGRVAAYVRGDREAQASPADALIGKIRTRRSDIARLLADWMHGVRCRDNLATAMRERGALRAGESFVVPEGHRVNAQGATLFAPDSELHGVLARQRELAELETTIVTAREQTATAATVRAEVDADLERKQQEYHGENMAHSSQQRRCHDLELELLALKQAAEAAEKRRTQIAEERAALAAEEAQEQAVLAAIDTELAASRGTHQEALAARDTLRHQVNEAEVALARGREHARLAERTAQEAGFAERSCRDRLAELDRRREAIDAQRQQLEGLQAQTDREHKGIDWSPVETSLQAQLGVRAEAEQSLAASRDVQEAAASSLRGAEEERLAADQKLEPARTRIDEVRLKEQAARLAEEQFASQLAEAHAELELLPEKLKAWGRASTLPAEIERLTQAIAALGAVNLAALDELTQASERKAYLDAQAQDLTEALTTS
jgi:chromosome segregation protein